MVTAFYTGKIAAQNRKRYPKRNPNLYAQPEEMQKTRPNHKESYVSMRQVLA